MANLHVAQLETPPLCRHFVENFGEDEAVDDVPGDLDLLKVSDGQLAAWQQGVAAPQVMSSLLNVPDGGMNLGPGRRPSPVITSAHAVVFYDTEAVVSTLVQTDDVYVVRSCR